MPYLHATGCISASTPIWFLPFGSAVARRFGTLRFLAFFAVTAAAGAALHLATHAGELVPMIGASAAISGTMAAAMRFAFQRGGPLGFLRSGDDEAYRVPALPLAGVLRDPPRACFSWWCGSASTSCSASARLPSLTGSRVVAWQAHIGGFLAGLSAVCLVRSAPDHAAIGRFLRRGSA